MAICRWSAGCPREDTFARLILGEDKVGGPEFRSVTTRKPISSQLQHRKFIRAALICLDSLVLHAKLSSRLDKVVWGIFWKVFRRSCGPPTRLVGPTNRSAGLLVGWIHLSGMTVSLVGEDPGVPMPHIVKKMSFAFVSSLTQFFPPV
jgi:hypothetical protein